MGHVNRQVGQHARRCHTRQEYGGVHLKPGNLNTRGRIAVQRNAVHTSYFRSMQPPRSTLV